MSVLRYLKLFATAIAVLIVSIFSLAYLTLNWHNYRTFQTGHDLAGYTQAVYNLTAGHLPYNSFKEFIMWGDHAHFIIILLTPLFSFFPTAQTILAVQTLVATTAGYALYRVAHDYLRHPLPALALLYSYLAFVGLQYALDFDFHPSVLTGASISWLLYAYYFKKWPLYWVVLILGLTTREDAPTIFFMIGIWQLLTQQWRVGLVTSLTSALYFLVTVYVLMPLWTPDHAVLTYLDTYEKHPFSIIREIISNPKTILQNITDTEAKQHTLHTLALSEAYLPLLSPFTYLTSAPIIYARFNGPNDYRWLLTNHSNANIQPLLAFGALFGLGHLLVLLERTSLRFTQASWQPQLRQVFLISISVLLVATTHVTAWANHAVPLRALWRELATTDSIGESTATAFNHLKTLIPPDASVTASSGFTAHLAQHRELKYFSADPITTDWIIVSPYANPWPFNRNEAQHAIKILQTNPEYELVATKATVFLFQRR